MIVDSIRSGSGLAGRNKRARFASGFDPGTMGGRIAQFSLPGSPPFFRKGMSPARTKLDLPLPEDPSTARKREVFIWLLNSAISRPRPKKTDCFDSWKE